MYANTDTNPDTDDFIAVCEVYKWNWFGQSLDTEGLILQ